MMPQSVMSFEVPVEWYAGRTASMAIRPFSGQNPMVVLSMTRSEFPARDQNPETTEIGAFLSGKSPQIEKIRCRLPIALRSPRKFAIESRRNPHAPVSSDDGPTFEEFDPPKIGRRATFRRHVPSVRPDPLAGSSPVQRPPLNVGFSLRTMRSQRHQWTRQGHDRGGVPARGLRRRLEWAEGGVMAE